MTESGESFIRRTAQFIRANAQSLSSSSSLSSSTASGTFPWVSSSPVRRTLAIDPPHLFYLLVQFDALGIHVGDLDRTVDAPARPSSRLTVVPDLSETRSLAESVFSTVSSFGTTLGPSAMSSWFAAPRTLESELKFIYSSFTKLPAIEIVPPSSPVLADFALDDHAVPLHVFKNLQRLQCTSLDPRMLIAWPPFLRSLSISDSGRDDIVDFLPTECSLLRHLSISNNELTSLPSIPLTSLVSLDLSNNLLVSVPPVLSELYNLASLSLAGNMIDSVLGIYTHLGNIQTLNLSHNRLESICGLERLTALERIDLRHNHISDPGEISRLALLPNISAVYVSSNPFCQIIDNYRVVCFDYFWKEGKGVTLDGSLPSWSEKRGLSPRPDGQMSSSRSAPTVLAATGANKEEPLGDKTVHPASVPRKKKKPKRIVDLDHHQIIEEDEEHEHSQERTDGTSTTGRTTHNNSGDDEDAKTPTATRPRHTRHRTEIVSSSYKDEQPAFTPVVRPPRRRDTTSASLPIAPSLPTTTTTTNGTSGKTKSSVSTTSSSPTPSRSSTMFSPTTPTLNSTSTTNGMNDSMIPIRPSPQRSATLASRSSKRAARVSASMFEPAPSRERMEADGEALRKRIEALKKEMGDGWLGVFSQSQVT